MKFPIALRRGYILCGYARTGSTLLCKALQATGRLGYAQEYFNPVAIELAPGERYPADRLGQITEIARRGTSANGLYGLKMFADQFDALDGFDWIGALPDPLFIHLERQDALAQALSHVRATGSGQWSSAQPTGAIAQYDEAAILDELSRNATYRGRWQMFFARNGITPLWLTYEDVVADLPGTVRRVASLLDVELADPLPKLDVIDRQADSISDDWRARFIASQRDLTRLDLPGNLPRPSPLIAPAAPLWRRAAARLTRLTTD
jgi:trehalose 2-sulfotransferase